MARGKIHIKRIENPINRQVTYSKRRKGLFKKAQELTVLCDVKVSIIMFSGNGRLHKYISPSTTMKQLIDEYQKTKGIDLWSAHYERMQENLKNLKEVNRGVRREIRQRSGESPNDLNLQESPNEAHIWSAVTKQADALMLLNKNAPCSSSHSGYSTNRSYRDYLGSCSSSCRVKKKEIWVS